jgi:hypothetical protein
MQEKCPILFSYDHWGPSSCLIFGSCSSPQDVSGEKRYCLKNGQDFLTSSHGNSVFPLPYNLGYESILRWLHLCVLHPNLHHDSRVQWDVGNRVRILGAETELTWSLRLSQAVPGQGQQNQGRKRLHEVQDELRSRWSGSLHAASLGWGLIDIGKMEESSMENQWKHYISNTEYVIKRTWSIEDYYWLISR